MNMAELRAKSKEELKELVVSLKQEQFNLRFQEATGALESRQRFKEARRTIARAKTILNEKPGAAAPAVKAPKAVAKKKTKAKKEE